MIGPGPLLLSEAQWLLQATSPPGVGSPALFCQGFTCGSKKLSKISKASKKEFPLIPFLSHCPEKDRFSLEATQPVHGDTRLPWHS